LSNNANPKNWSAELDSIEELCTIAGMTSSRLLRLLQRNLAAEVVEGAKHAQNRAVAKSLGWRNYKSGGAAFRIAAVNNRYGIIPANVNNELIVPTVADLIDENTDAVVELGCGFGRHLFALRDLLEHEQPQLKYFGFELSRTGLEAGEKIAALEPDRKNISFRKFDYLAPTFEFLSGFSNIVFFTCHSIEQVQFISEDLFREIVRTAANVRCVHCEPVGWQLNDELMTQVESDQEISIPEDSFRLLGEVSDHFSASIPVNTGWNRNLIRTLRKLQTDSVLNIDFMDKNCAGNSYYNPSTLIQWTKVT